MGERLEVTSSGDTTIAGASLIGNALDLDVGVHLSLTTDACA